MNTAANFRTVKVTDFPVVNDNGTPRVDFTGFAERVNATDVKVGDFVGNGAGMFVRVTRAPRPFRGCTRFEVWDEGRGGTKPFRAMDSRPGAQVWVAR